MNTIVLAFSGGFASSNAVHWLAETRAADVVTLTLDLGQGEDLAALRDRALSCGAARVHACDARDELVREFLLPSLDRPASDSRPDSLIAETTAPLIARKLLEVAHIEGAAIVAHGSSDTSIDAWLRALNPRIGVVAPAREWQMDATQLANYARAHRVPPRYPSDPNCRIDQHLWGRLVSFGDADVRPKHICRDVLPPSEAAHLEIGFEAGVPVSINDVPMAPVELVESLALIAGRHGIGRVECSSNGRTLVFDAPAAAVLYTARTAIGGPAGTARLCVRGGECVVLDPHTEAVNLA